MKRKGRGIDNRWDIRKYKGDAALYAYCRCGWYYSCGDTISRKDPETWILHNYCSYCGAHKKWYNGIPKEMNRFQYGG